MVDTIRIKLHDLNEHSSLAHGLLLNQSTFARYTHMKQISGYNLNLIPMQFYMDVIRFGDTGKEIPKILHDKLHIPSSHYYVIYNVRFDLNFIWFEFSVPKFLYGNNIAQFIKSPYAKDFQLFSATQWEYQVNILYDRLKAFIKHFFKSQFYDEHINYSKLELCRIDLCYNQYFNSKDEALQYLELQKRKRKKMSRDTSQGHNIQQYGISYKSKTYYFKIYHKGTEYNISDKREHLKYNEYASKHNINTLYTNQPKLKHINIQSLQNQADLILRYELTFRSSGMSYYYKHHIFRNNCPVHKKLMSRYRYQRNLYRKDPKMLDKQQLTQFKKFQSILDKTHNFYPFYNSDLLSHSKITDGEHYSEAPFTRTLLKLLINKFAQNIQEYQLQELPPIEQALLKIKEYNETVNNRKKSINKEFLRPHEFDKYNLQQKNTGRIKNFFYLLNNYTYDEIKQMGIYSNRTITRYKSLMKTLFSIDERAIKKSDSMYINPKTDFSDYYIHNIANADIFINTENVYI
jgi:hypothetical protein